MFQPDHKYGRLVENEEQAMHDARATLPPGTPFKILLAPAAREWSVRDAGNVMAWYYASDGSIPQTGCTVLRECVA